jgi:hypothetical protein
MVYSAGIGSPNKLYGIARLFEAAVLAVTLNMHDSPAVKRIQNIVSTGP